jgi:tRNA threonylcarbamoyladenosine biosynthesis protein TsaB
MRILAIETSGHAGSIALLQNEEIVREIVIAAQAGLPGQSLSVALDAQRQQVFACEFQCQAAGCRALHPPTIVDNDAWIAGLKPGGAVSGPALEKLAARIPAEVVIVPSDRWSPSAGTVGQLGWQRYQSGQRDDLWRLVPTYFRLSAAEEKLAARPSATPVPQVKPRKPPNGD